MEGRCGTRGTSTRFMRWTFYLMSDPADIRSSNNSLGMDLSNCKSLLLLRDTDHPWVTWSLIVLHHAPSRLHWFTRRWGGGGLGVWKEKLVWFMTCLSCTEFVCWLLGLHTRYGYCSEMWWGLYRATFLQHPQQDQSSWAGSTAPVENFILWARSMNEKLCKDLFLPATFPGIYSILWCATFYQPTGPFYSWRNTCCAHL